MALVIKIIAIICIFCTQAIADTYWVNPTGSASWESCKSPSDPGTKKYCSLDTANKNAKAGDIIYLKEGTYQIDPERTGIAPKNSGAGIGPGRIIYSKLPNEEKPTLKGGNVGVQLGKRAFIKIDGIKFFGFKSYSAYLSNYSHHNEITNCDFYGGLFVIFASCQTNPATYTCNSTNNWIHKNTFTNIGGGGPCREGGDALRVGSPWVGDGKNDYNTIENNTFTHAGHATISAFGFHYAVIKNNISRNNPWWTANGVGNKCQSDGFPVYSNSAFNNKWGHRNFAIGFTPDASNSYSLIEGNRLGFQSPNPGNYGDANLALEARAVIVRHNYSFGAMRMGLYFKYVNSKENNLGGTNTRVYNNTIFRNGFGYEGGGPAATRRVGVTFDNYQKTGTDNVLINNIVFNNRDGDFGNSGGSLGAYGKYDVAMQVENNWCTALQSGCSGFGDPKFVNPDVSNPALIAKLPDLSLRSDSPVIDEGVNLTNATIGGTNSNVLVVKDSLYFQDGSWGSDLARGVTFFPDWIAIENVDNIVEIASINYSNNTIRLKSNMTWSNGAKIWLYKNSDGKVVLHGAAPDFGASEYEGSTVNKDIKKIEAPKNVRILS